MLDLKKTLISKLDGARRIAVLGIGSDLRGDDAAGIIVAETLEKRIKSLKPRIPIGIFVGATAPENLTGEIRRFRPSHILIVDSLEMKKKTGSVIALEIENVGGGVSFSTHTMPARILADYFLQSLKCRVIMIGIQPKSIKFGLKASKNVVISAKNVARSILKATESLTN
ncbi:MAG: hydrogenase 3 maturation endopeptidase HyCI [Candidatus Omnitrophota bacterium]